MKGLVRARQALGWLRHRSLRRLHVVMLAAPVREAAEGAGTIEEYRSYSPRVLEHLQAQGRKVSEETVRRRFERGLCFFVLRRGDVTMATTWLVMRGERFVDELGLGLAIPAGAAWLRDVYVHPSYRGRGLFGALIDAAAARADPPVHVLFSAVGLLNKRSLRAHERYGFAPRARYRALAILGLLLFRQEWPVWPEGSHDPAPGRRLVWMGPAFRRFLMENLA